MDPKKLISLQAVVFDFDGTIADSEPAHLKAFQQTLASRNVILTHDDYLKHYLGLEDYETFSLALPNEGPQVWQQLVAEKTQIFQTLLGEIDFNPGFEALLTTLSQRYVLAICSGALRRDIEGVFLKRPDLFKKFKLIVSADDVEHAKPDPEIYRLAVARLGVTSHQSVAIEDTPVGLSSAHAAGLATIGITHTVTRAQLKLADYVVDHLLEIPQLLGA